MTTKSSDWPMANTSHGMLVAFGEFFSQHGLIERLMQIPIGQKTRKYRPQTKLVEFLPKDTGTVWLGSRVAWNILKISMMVCGRW